MRSEKEIAHSLIKEAQGASGMERKLRLNLAANYIIGNVPFNQWEELATEHWKLFAPLMGVNE